MRLESLSPRLNWSEQPICVPIRQNQTRFSFSISHRIKGLPRSGKALKVHFFTFKLKKYWLIDNNNWHVAIISETSLLELSEIISADWKQQGKRNIHINYSSSGTKILSSVRDSSLAATGAGTGQCSGKCSLNTTYLNLSTFYAKK